MARPSPSASSSSASPPPSSSSMSTPKPTLRQRRAARLSLSGLLWKRKAANNRQEGNGGASSTSASLSPLPPSAERERHRFSSFLSPRSGPSEELDPLLVATYSDPTAVKAFVEALAEDQGHQEPPPASASSSANAWAKLGLPSLRSPTGPTSPTNNSSDAVPTQTIPTQPPVRRVGKIAAVSDFAPVRERTTKDSGRREGFVYALLRWPLLIFIFLTIGLEFFAYVLTRQIVNVVEWLVAHRGRKGVLRRKMRKATNFAQWTDTALELDDFMDHERWKRQDSSGMYDWILVKKVLHSLKTFRELGDDNELMAVLDLCCRNNFAGTENFRLYSETYFGTKYLIEEYLNEVERGLEYITKTDTITVEQKRTFFRAVSKNLGRSGLCLSGGGSFGYYHIGLVKALLDASLLPKIVSGTSAGGLIAALTCTRTDEELSRLLVPELADRITACEEPLRIWAKRAWQTGARFDPGQWADKAGFFTLGSLTFKEAYERTGKTLNVSVIPSERNSPVKLLNYLTAPRCVIWSALLASAAVPGLLPPVCLMQKTRKGEYVPWNWGHRFKDGSLRVDIPLQDLHSMFHVNYPIVSQVNPHVHLFFFAPTGNPGRPVAHRRGKGWRGGFLLSASEHVLKLHLAVNFKIIRDLDLLPRLLGTDWSGVFLQRFGGAVTIYPRSRIWDFVRILSDPDRTELGRMMKVGQRATWPKLHMIENRMRLERAVERGRRSCRQELRLKQRREQQAQNQQAVRGAYANAVAPPSTAGSSNAGWGEPHQDSGTDASGHGGGGGAFTPAAPSDTDGEGTYTLPSGDYFHPRLGAGKMGFSAMTPGSTASGLNTPADVGNGTGLGVRGSESSMPNTPGELPRQLRARSAYMEEASGRDADEIDEDLEHDADVDADETMISGAHGGAGGETGADESLTAGGDRATGGREASTNHGIELLEARGERLAAHADQEEANATMGASPARGVALTAAALSPSVGHRHHHREGSSSGHHPRRRSRQNSSQGGGAAAVVGNEHGAATLPATSSTDSVAPPSSSRPRRNSAYRFHHTRGGAPPSPYGPAHPRDWSGGRGSIGPRSPWDNDDDEDGFGPEEDESDTSSSAGSASEARSR